MSSLRAITAHPSALVRLSLVGAATATLFDAVHVRTQTLSYPRPFLFGQDAFVFPGFVAAFTTMAIVYAALAARLPPSIPRAVSTSPADRSEFVGSLTGFALAYALSGYGNRDPVLLAVILYATALLRLALAPDRVFMTIVALLLALGGTLVEGAMTKFDLVHYREPEIFGVPFWLGALYMHGAFSLRDAMRFFIYRSPAAKSLPDTPAP